MDLSSMERDRIPYFRRLLDGAVILVVGFLSVIIYVSFRDLGLDDAYITYRMAENAANGLGLVYNQGERVLVSTTPMFTVLLSVVGLIYRDIPDVGALFGGIGLFGSAMFLYFWIKSVQGFVTALTAAILFVSFPLLSLTMGMETLLYLMLSTGAFYFYFNQRLMLTAFLLGLLLLTRADGIVLASVIFLHFVCVNRRFPVRQFILYVGLTVPWFVFSQLYYGSPFPATLSAKMAHGQSFWWSRHFLEGAQALAYQYYREDPLFLLFLVFGALGLVVIVITAPKLRLLFVWAVLYSVGYTLLGVPEYHWYYAPLVPPVMVAVAVGVTQPIRMVLRWPILRLERSVNLVSIPLSLLLFSLLAYVLVQSEIRLAKAMPDPRFEIYKEAGLWLNENSGPDATTAMIEIGTIGYYSKRVTIDMIGLTHPDVASQIASNDFSYAIRRYWPDYLVVAAPVVPEMQSAPWFGERYLPVKYLRNARFGAQPLVIYAKAKETLAGQLKVKRASFDGIIGLEGFAVRPDVGQPGGNVRVNLLLKRLQPIPRDIGVFVHLLDVMGRMIAQRDVLLEQDAWEDSQMNQHFDIYVPMSAAPGKYEIQAGLYYLPGVERLPVKEKATDSPSDRLSLGTVKIPNRGNLANPSNPLSATFAEKISLQGYDITVDSDDGTRRLNMRLHWKAKDQIVDDLTVFVHLLDSQGKLVSQHDGQPQGATYPTSIWDIGETVIDSHTIQLSDNVSAGEYSVAIGMYNGSTGKRLEARSDNTKVSDNAIIVERIRLP